MVIANLVLWETSYFLYFHIHAFVFFLHTYLNVYFAGNITL